MFFFLVFIVLAVVCARDYGRTQFRDSSPVEDVDCRMVGSCCLGPRSLSLQLDISQVSVIDGQCDARSTVTLVPIAPGCNDLNSCLRRGYNYDSTSIRRPFRLLIKGH